MLPSLKSKLFTALSPQVLSILDSKVLTEALIFPFWSKSHLSKATCYSWTTVRVCSCQEEQPAPPNTHTTVPFSSSPAVWPSLSLCSSFSVSWSLLWADPAVLENYLLLLFATFRSNYWAESAHGRVWQSPELQGGRGGAAPALPAAERWISSATSPNSIQRATFLNSSLATTFNIPFNFLPKKGSFSWAMSC